MSKIVDLFAGVGGLSLGAERAGFNVIGAVELDPIALETHRINFPKSKHMQGDLSYISGTDICESFDIKVGELEGLIGGPPCQGFSVIGKRNQKDPRNELFIHFFRLASELLPNFFIVENVPGILDKKYNRVRKKALELIKDKYTVMKPIIINAKDYGAPTARERVFFIGYKNDSMEPIEVISFLPDETCRTNYVKDALIGLPIEMETYDKGLHWCQIEKGEPGSYPEIISKIFSKRIGDEEAKERYTVFSEVTGIIGTRHANDVAERYSRLQPGQKDDISKSYRLRLDGFCLTLRAGTGKERGSFQAVRPIHPIDGRVINPREAARIQGFPDWFQFHQTKWHSFRQIGNSVSPIISEFILGKIMNHISKNSK